MQAFAAGRGLSVVNSLARVVIRTKPELVPIVKSRVEALGGTFEMSATGLVLARVPVSALESLAAASEVSVVRRPQAPTLFQTTSQGLNVIGGPTWHQAGHKGAGVKVAVLDVGFEGYESLMGTELPQIPDAQIVSFSGDITGGGEKHGTAVAEIVFDIAPEADLYLVNASNEVELESAVQWLIDHHINVINASWGYPCGGPLDGTGWTNALVKRAADAGILWVNAAGNFAQRHWSGTFSDTNNNGWHNFSPTEDANVVYMASGDEIETCMEWDDWTKKDQDYDLYVWDSSGSIVASSTDDQSGPDTHDPQEFLSFTASSAGYYYIGIKNDRTTRNSTFHLYAYPQGSECAIETVSGTGSKSNGTLAEIRAFRDQVLRSSAFGRSLITSYYQHSPEVVRILRLHPLLAIEALRLVRASKPAVSSVVGIRSGDLMRSRFAISEEYVASVDRFLDHLVTVASPALRDSLRALRAKLALSGAAGQTADQYWEWLLKQEPIDSAVPLALFPDSGYMRYTSAATSLVPPADSPYAFTVGAANWASDALEEFTSQGPTSDGRLKPDIAAPDGVCTVTIADCAADGFLGTSAAAPHVAGAAALVRQVYPSASLADLRNFLTGRAVDLAPAGPDNQSGAGRLSLGSAGIVDVIPAPSASAPTGASVPTWPTFRWSKVSGADSYRLMVTSASGALPSDPTSPICSGCVLNTTSSANYYTPPKPLDPGTTYLWQVQGRAAGKSGAWSPRVSFTTTAAPEQTQPERSDLLEESGPWPTSAGKAVVITHGWSDNAEGWVKEISEKLCGRLGAGVNISSSVKAGTLTKMCQAKGWDIWVMDWREKAATTTPWDAFTNATDLGEMLALNLKAKNYTHIHFIAHSAGANLIDFASLGLRYWVIQDRRPALEIHDTFLDAYDPSLDPSHYGRQADWTDNYVDTRDVADLFVGFDGTRLFLQNGYNIDVTPAVGDPCLFSLTSVFGCRHNRPYRFYGRSVDSSFVGDAISATLDPIPSNGTGTMGYPLSTEAGNALSALSSTYPKGLTCVMKDGICKSEVVPTSTQSFISAAIGGTVDAIGGYVSWVVGAGVTLLFNSIKLGFISILSTSGGASAAAVAPSATPTESPSWIAVTVTTTQPVNKMRCSWRFSAGGEGFLRVFVDGMLVREIDQRHVSLASLTTEDIYIGGGVGMLPPGAHRIAFRLDGFGTSASGVELTGVELGLTSALEGRRRSVRH